MAYFISGDIYCGEAFSTVLNKTSSMIVDINDGSDCLVFDVDTFLRGPDKTSQATKDSVKNFCGVSLYVFFLTHFNLL